MELEVQALVIYELLQIILWCMVIEKYTTLGPWAFFSNGNWEPKEAPSAAKILVLCANDAEQKYREHEGERKGGFIPFAWQEETQAKHLNCAPRPRK